MNKDKTGFIVNCEPYTRKEIRYARTDRKLKKNLTRYDTIIVSVKDSIQKVSVAQKAGLFTKLCQEVVLANIPSFFK